MTRRKSPAQPAPQTLDQAIALLTRYSTLAAGLAQVNVDREEALAQINAAADKLTAPIEAELRDLVLQLKPWWAVARDELTQGKRKSIELAGCVIGYRMSTPSLQFEGKALTKKNQTEAVAEVEARGYDWLLRIKKEIDKQAVLKALASGEDPVIVEMRFSSRQREEFFVDRVPPKVAPVEMVEDPAAGEAA